MILLETCMNILPHIGISAFNFVRISMVSAQDVLICQKVVTLLVPDVQALAKTCPQITGGVCLQL